MARTDFIEQLKTLGFNPQELDGKKLSFEYTIPVGRNMGKVVLLGFEVGNDFPMNCPSGPHFKSVGLPGWIDPSHGLNPSPFGGEWYYWSRPFRDWNRTVRTVQVYMAHIRNLLATL